MLHYPRANAPIRHILLMRFLGLSPKEFFEYIETENVESYREATQEADKTVFVPKKSQQMHDPDWQAQLQALWSNPDISLRGISRELQVDPITIKRYAAKLGLAFPRPGHRCTRLPTRKRRRIVSFDKLLLKYRTRWLRALQKHPKLGPKALRKSCQGTYIWLYRHDRDWLKDHQPPRVQPKPFIRIDWASRDREIARMVPDAVKDILQSSGRPVQITRAEMSRRIGKRAIIQQHIDYLPLTNKALSKYEETRVAFALRRIDWAKASFKKERMEPNYWDFVKRSGTGKTRKMTRI